MKRSEDRILTTHVGSLPRPPEMLELSTWFTGPAKDPQEYERRMRAAVRKVVKQQADAGLDVINDGEFGKGHWAGYIMNRLSGLALSNQLSSTHQCSRFSRTFWSAWSSP